MLQTLKVYKDYGMETEEVTYEKTTDSLHFIHGFLESGGFHSYEQIDENTLLYSNGKEWATVETLVSVEVTPNDAILMLKDRVF